MSEPNLILAYSDFRTEIADMLGYGRTEGKWTAAKTERISRILNSAYRRFLFPPVLPGEQVPHRWSFLSPVNTLSAWAATTGTVDGTPAYDAASYSTITATSSVFKATMVGKSFVFGTSGTSYTIYSYESGTQVKVEGDASGETADDTFSIAANGDYPLPDNFGSLLGDFVTNEDMNVKRIVRRGVSYILQLRARDEDLTGEPEYFAIAAQSHDGTKGQRYQAMFWPIPDANYLFSYRYEILRDKLTTDYPYPAGAEKHAETLLAACKAEVDEYLEQETGKRARFYEELVRSVQADRWENTPDNLGYNQNDQSYYRGRRTTQTPTITYNGSEI